MDNGVSVLIYKPISIFTMGIGGITFILSVFFTFMYYAAFSVELGKAEQNYPDFNEDWTTYTILINFCVLLTINVGVIIASVLLIVGTVKRRHRHMLPWLIICGISIVATSCFTIFVLLALDKPGGIFTSGIWFAFVQVIVFYPIYNLYKEIRKENQPRRPVQRPAPRPS